jgi:hypothetical protein
MWSADFADFRSIRNGRKIHTGELLYLVGTLGGSPLAVTGGMPRRLSNWELNFIANFVANSYRFERVRVRAADK